MRSNASGVWDEVQGLATTRIAPDDTE